MKLLRYILFVIAVVSLQSGLAQRSDYQPEFTVGVKGGTTLSRVSFTPTVTQSLLLGYTGGVSVRYIEEKFFGLIAEINFTQCGWNEYLYSYVELCDNSISDSFFLWQSCCAWICQCGASNRTFIGG